MNGIDELIPGSKIVLKKRIKPSKRANIPNKEEDNQLWSQKHRPRSLKDFCGNKKEVKQILNWLKQFQKGKLVKRCLFISGSPGIGKTTIAQLALMEVNYDHIEFNASDVRSQKSIKQSLEKIFQSDQLNLSPMLINPLGIIMDEVDGMSNGDRGGLQELVSLLKKKDYINPVICISNTNSEKKLAELRKISECVQFRRPSPLELSQCARKIAQRENIEFGAEVLGILVKYSQQDFRRLVNICQELHQMFKHRQISIEDMEQFVHTFAKKKIDTTLFEASYTLLNEYQSLDNVCSMYEIDRSLISMMLHENYLTSLLRRKTKKQVKMNICQHISYYLAQGDVIDKYVYNYQLWDLQTMNGIVKCGLISFILDHLPKKNGSEKQHDGILFTNLLSKSALQRASFKNSVYFKNKCSLHHNYHRFACPILLENALNSEPTLWKRYSFMYSDLEKIFKLIQSPEWKKKINNKARKTIRTFLSK